MSGLADLDTINSTSSEGVAVVIVTFKDKADPQTVAIEVEKRVNGIRGQLPNDIIAPTILKFDFTAAPIITLGLTGANVTPAQAFRIADELVRPKLETTNGVGQVSIFGGQQREVQVKVDPNRLRAYNVTLAQVSPGTGSRKHRRTRWSRRRRLPEPQHPSRCKVALGRSDPGHGRTGFAYWRHHSGA